VLTHVCVLILFKTNKMKQAGRKRSNYTTSTKSTTKKRSKPHQKFKQTELYQNTAKLPHHACGYHSGVCSLDNAACKCAARGHCEKYCGCDPNTCTIRSAVLYIYMY
jgi:hypothetical protein